MKVAVTGATGLVGHWIAADLLEHGHNVVTLGHTPSAHPTAAHLPYVLGDVPALEGCDAVVHAAFHHVPGRYRGGEGDDPEGFRRRNLDGTLRLFDAARAAGLSRVVFLSTRAVYGDYPPGTRLTEDLPPRPDTLYGDVKLAAEQALAAAGLTGVSLRATGVYGPPVPGRPHKWQNLFGAFGRGETLSPRIATEVHASDLAAAVRLALTVPQPPPLLNVSDIVLDRRDLLRRYADLTGGHGRLPLPGDPTQVSEMDTTRLRSLGWRPGGLGALDGTLEALAGG